MSETSDFLHYITQPGYIMELRLFWPEDVKSGQYNRMDEMASDALCIQGRSMQPRTPPSCLIESSQEWANRWNDGKPIYPNIYYTLNPISPKHAKRRINNFVANRQNAATNHDIACRNLYLIDVDTVRTPEYDKACSTDAEKMQARIVARQVKFYLKNQGWPDPIAIDSGNGYHLLYKGDRGPLLGSLPFALKSLAAMFNSPGAKVDICVHNPSRIDRLPGTMNRKGPNTQERPHRLCRVVSYPEKWEAVTTEQINTLASYSMSARSRSSLAHADRPRRELTAMHDDIIDFIDEFDEILILEGWTNSGDDTYYALSECPFKGAAHRGQDGGMGKTCIVLKPNVIGFHCFSDDCDGRTFGDLLRLLRNRTGRSPSMAFYDDTDLEDSWEIMGVVSIDDAEREEEEETIPEATTSSKPTTETGHPKYDWFATHAEEYVSEIVRDEEEDARAEQTYIDQEIFDLPTHPNLWGVTWWDDIIRPFMMVAYAQSAPSAYVADVVKREDIDEACQYLGTKRLFDLTRLKDSGRIRDTAQLATCCDPGLCSFSSEAWPVREPIGVPDLAPTPELVPVDVPETEPIMEPLSNTKARVDDYMCVRCGHGPVTYGTGFTLVLRVGPHTLPRTVCTACSEAYKRHEWLSLSDGKCSYAPMKYR